MTSEAKIPSPAMSPIEYDGGAIFINPASSDRHLAGHAIASLQEYPLFAGVRPTDISLNENQNFDNVLGAINGKRKLVAVLSGDGGFKSVAEAVAYTDSTVLGLGFGNANIIHSILNGQRNIRYPRQLSHPSLAVEQQINFMDVEFNDIPHHAIIGAGFGLTGEFAYALNHPDYRNSKAHSSRALRFISELLLAKQLVREVSEGKHVVHLDNEDLLSFDVLNGPLLAKYMRYPQLDITTPSALQLLLPSAPYLPTWVRHIQTGEWPYSTLSGNQVTEFTIRSDDTKAYVDGESFNLKHGTVFRMSISDLTVQVLANRSAHITTPKLAGMARLTRVATESLMKKPIMPSGS